MCTIQLTSEAKLFKTAVSYTYEHHCDFCWLYPGLVYSFIKVVCKYFYGQTEGGKKKRFPEITKRLATPTKFHKRLNSQRADNSRTATRRWKSTSWAQCVPNLSARPSQRRTTPPTPQSWADSSTPVQRKPGFICRYAFPFPPSFKQEVTWQAWADGFHTRCGSRHSSVEQTDRTRDQLSGPLPGSKTSFTLHIFHFTMSTKTLRIKLRSRTNYTNNPITITYKTTLHFLVIVQNRHIITRFITCIRAYVVLFLRLIRNTWKCSWFHLKSMGKQERFELWSAFWEVSNVSMPLRATTCAEAAEFFTRRNKKSGSGNND